jgi:peptide-methionine (S)-S-oxide reductase
MNKIITFLLLLNLSCGIAKTNIVNKMNTEVNGLDTLVVGGGCFWCTEAVFLQLKGVEKVESGYAGGSIKNPSYKEICTGRTGHAEVVRVYFDSEVISLKQLLEVFFTTHDPTTLNRQGADVGTQYRSVVFYKDEFQKSTTLEVINELENEQVFSNPIVTEISPLPVFYIAEDYHQNYYNKNPTQGYCSFVITPKIFKLREKHKNLLK